MKNARAFRKEKSNMKKLILDTVDSEECRTLKKLSSYGVKISKRLLTQLI